VRERLVAWLQDVEPAALPRLRVDLRPARTARHPARPSSDGQGEQGANLFSGSVQGEERGAAYARPEDER